MNSHLQTDFDPGIQTAVALSVSKRAKTKQHILLSQDSTNRSIALNTVFQEPQFNLIQSQIQQVQTLKEQGDFEQALEQLEQIQTHYKSIDRLHKMMQEAEILSIQGNYPQALVAYEQLRLLLKVTRDLNPQEHSRLLALILLNQAWVLQQLDQFQAALNAYNQSIEKLESLLKSDLTDVIPSLMIAHRQRSMSHRSLQNTAASQADLERASVYQDILMAPVETSMLEMVSDWFSLAMVQQQLANWSDALESLDKALKASSDIKDFQEQKLWAGMIQTQRARCMEELGSLDSAVYIYDSALRHISSETAPRQWALVNLLRSALLLRLQRPDALEAIQPLQDSLESLEQSSETQDLAVPLIALASLCSEQNTELALDLYSRAIRYLEQSDRSQIANYTYLLLEAYSGRGNVLNLQGQYQKALHSFKQACRLADTILSGDALAEVYLQFALCLQSNQKFEQALETFEQAERVCHPDPESPVLPDSVAFRAIYFQAFVYAADLNQAQKALEVLFRLDRQCPGQVDYDLACLLSRVGQTQFAINYLMQHLQSPQASHLEDILSDPDLADLQSHPQWPDVLEQVKEVTGRGRDQVIE